MRSTFFFHFSFIAVALAGGLVGAACGSGAGSSFDSKSGAPSDEATSGGNGTSFNTNDAASAIPEKRNLTSPLCEYAEGAAACIPDDDGVMALPAGAPICATRLDGGAGDADASTETKACRIRNSVPDGGTAAYAPNCTEDTDRNGTDGVSCKRGSDCAPGFDCVDGEMGSVCRRYCCAGSCEKQSSLNGGPTFCDIQRLAEFSEHKAPVCMPLKSCKLLRDGECGADETCAVVTEKGETGCVLKGHAKAGASCDEDHCESGLTCLGSAGDRRCYKLCRIDGPDCASMQTCTTGSVFQDTTFGVCTDN